MYKKTMKRIITLCFGMILAFSFLIEDCMAVTPSYTVSSSYKEGIYYQKLLSVSLTGNQVDDIVKVALSQRGYHEGVSTNDLSGDVTTSTTKKQKYNEYGYMHGNTNDDWCAYFVSWCARQAQIPTSIIPKSGSCSTICNTLKTRYYDVTSDYLPKKGDLILLEPSSGVSPRNATTGVPEKSGHIGIVIEDCDGKTIQYVEGNNGDVVRTNSCEVFTTRGNSRRVQGYLHPKYNNSSTTNSNGTTVENIAESIKVKVLNETNVTSNNATLNASCTKPSSSVIIDTCGIYFGTSESELTTKIVEEVGSGANAKDGGTGFNIWYDVNEDLGWTLSPGRTYYYRFFCSYNNKEIKSDVKSFTTKSAAVTTDQEALVYIYGGNKGTCYSTSTGNKVSGTFDASSGQILCHTYSYVDLPNGARRYEYIGSNGVSYWLQFDASCMGVTYLPKTITTPSTHIYLDTEINTMYMPTFNQSPSNADDPIKMLYGYDTDIVSVHQGSGGVFTIEANGVGTTEVTFQGVYSEIQTKIKVTVVDGGAPAFSGMGLLESDGNTFKFKAEVTDKDMARFGVQIWRKGENEEDVAIDWYERNSFMGSYGAFEYNDSSNNGDYVLSYTVDRDDLNLAGGMYLIAIYAQDAYGGVSGRTMEFYVEPSDESLSFTDVIKGQYYYVPVMWAVDESITNGFSETVFGTGASCTREQIVTFLWNYSGKPEATVSSCSFKDADSSHYYYKAMLWATEHGYVSGYNAETFGVGNPCTREQIVMILWKYAGSPEPMADTCTFKDAMSNGYYYKAMLWATENGIVAGYSSDVFGVNQPCTREQIVTFLYRYDNL